MNSRSKPRIAVVGGGLGGLAAAALMQQAEFEVTVFEQAPALARIGAGINLSPNVTRILRAIGIDEKLRGTAVQPRSFISRMFDTGEETFRLEMGDAIEAKYGAPYFTVHRGDFHSILADAVRPDSIAMSKRLVSIQEDERGVELHFSDGARQVFDLVIGADGVNSTVREILLGPEAPRYTGYLAHRAIFPANAAQGLALDDCTKWWSPDRHIIVYFLTGARDELYFVTGVPSENWDAGASSREGSISALRETFADFEPRVQKILDACTDVSEWALYERNPLPLWSRGRVAMLGDACHPMKPHMGQGACMAIEDAAMLVRCLKETGADEYDAAFSLYRENRIDRATAIQHESSLNRWLRHDTNPDWVFGYDVFNVPLVDRAREATSDLTKRVGAV
ncbi:FAD-dependent monooxygenase [Paraburkholderia sp. RL18-101-BIB-B]|uniref:FAD-dependent monooxygenase n=1 Tax=Paraburkholderia sp. RL18-101-BIB-B TaxID=3031634 RepID=UPI0038BD5E0E